MRMVHMQAQVIILGAGVSGLTAARVLQDRGIDVLVLDKGRGVGGRVATRWQGEPDHIRGRWDHGAQFATFRDPDLIRHLQQWNCWNLLEDWLPGYHDATLARKRPLNGMNAFAKALAKGLKIERGCRVSHLKFEKEIWTLSSENAEPYSAPQLISTLPIPQFLDLQHSSLLTLSADELSLLRSVRYARCLTLLAELDGPSGLDLHGYQQLKSGILEILCDQHQKGISTAHCVVAHANPGFSLEWYDRDRNTAASVMRAALQEKLASPIIKVQIHGWKFAKALQRIPRPCLQLQNGCVLAGDGFAGDDLHPRIESAMLSGLAAAHLL